VNSPKDATLAVHSLGCKTQAIVGDFGSDQQARRELSLEALAEGESAEKLGNRLIYLSYFSGQLFCLQLSPRSRD
jgi:hypothetical protein